MAFLEISGLRKRFGALEILKGIDLTLDKGGFLVLVGPSGCGKSTLLNTIAGLEIDQLGRDPDRGRQDQRSSPVEARHRNGLPVLRPLSEHVGGAEHRLRHGNARRAKAAARQGGGRCRQDAEDRAPAVAPSEPALRRPAAARRHGARARASAARVPVRRAPIQPRRQAARRHARGDQATSSADRRDDRLCHA